MDTWIKRRTDAPSGLFAAEIAGLGWLNVPGGAPVVQVFGSTDTTLTLARIHTVPPSTAAAEAFGAALAVTHNAGASAFGCGPGGFTGQSYIADLPISTSPTPTWGVFFATQRLLPFAKLAQSELGPQGLRTIETLATRLADKVFDDDAPPARLHGDLWAGNILFTKANATLIDPSAHGGHRLTDLAMLALFGAPHLETIFRAYETASTHLPNNWRNLLSLHQVYPLLVHTVLFGGGYANAAVSAARAYL